MHIQIPALASWPRSSSGATRTFRGTPQGNLHSEPELRYPRETYA